MSDACKEKAYNTAYDALFSDEGRELSAKPGAECKKCKQCGKWHLRANAWHPESKPDV